MTQTDRLHNFPTSRKWQAKWIWADHAPGRNAYLLFRKEFDLNASEDCLIHISADTRYRLWVNGTYISDGPPQSQPFHQYYDSRDLSSTVKKGVNCVAVLVNHQVDDI